MLLCFTTLVYALQDTKSDRFKLSSLSSSLWLWLWLWLFLLLLSLTSWMRLWLRLKLFLLFLLLVSSLSSLLFLLLLLLLLWLRWWRRLWLWLQLQLGLAAPTPWHSETPHRHCWKETRSAPRLALMDSSMHRPSDLDCWFPLSTSKLLRSVCLKSIISQIHGMSYKDTPCRFHQLFEQITLQPECMMLCCSLVQAGSSLFITG